MAKYDDPERLRVALAEKDATIQDLYAQVKDLPRERKQFQRATEEATSEKEAADQARADHRDAQQRIRTLEAELASERSARQAEAKELAAARDLAAAVKALS